MSDALFFGLTGLILAIIAMARANKSKAQADELASRLARLERDFAKLKSEESSTAAPTPSPKVSELVARQKPPPIPPPLPSAAALLAKPAVSTPPSQNPMVVREREPESKLIPEPSFDWKALLQRFHLWPPNQAASNEVGLAGWWTTRLGILLAVIAVVFLGVYVNKQTASWIRWVELLGIGVSVCVAGRLFETKHGRYGEIISAGGLAMLFFTAFAAHGVEAVQITDSAVLGAVLQCLSLALMLAWCLWKRDEPLAGAVFGLGYVSCWFTEQHGLAPITIGGLVLLGVASSALLAHRRWWLPAWIACFGSLGGLLLLTYSHLNTSAIQAWQIMGTSATLLLGSLVALRFHYQGDEEPRPRRRFLIVQGSLTTAVSVLSVLLINANQLSTLYVTLAITFAIYTWAAYQTFEDELLFQAFFLKSSTFVALFVVSQFDGPTRWITLSAQALGVLWTMRHATQPCRWLELAFVGLLGSSYALFLHDTSLLDHHSGRITAWLYLSFASLVATLYHQGWATVTRTQYHHQIAPLMAVLLGLGWALSVQSIDASVFTATVYLAAAWLMLGLAQWRQNWIPLISGGMAVVSGLITPWFTEPTLHFDSINFSMTLALITTGFIIAVLSCRKYAMNAWATRCVVTTIWIVASLLAAWLACQSLSEQWSPYAGTIAFFAIVLVMLMPTARLLNHRKLTLALSHPESKYRSLIAILLGFMMMVFANQTLASHAFPIAMLLLTGLVLLVSSRLKDSLASLAMAIPAFAGILAYDLPADSTVIHWSLIGDGLLGVTLVASLTAGAWQLSTRVGSKALDAGLHLASLSVLYQFSQRHLSPSTHWLAMALLVFAVLRLGKIWPFQALRLVAWAPAIVMLARALESHPELLGTDHICYGSGAAVLMLAWCLDRREHRETWFSNIALVIAGSCMLWATFAICDLPWRLPTLALLGLIFTLLWRWLRDSVLGWSAIVMATIALLSGFEHLTNSSRVDHSYLGLVATLVSVTMILIQGWLLASFSNHARWLGGALVTWMHALIPMTLAFTAMITPSLGITDLATVGWGVASILLFVSGLTLGLKPYRIAGLVGLLACVVRVFAVDLQDTFYRIIAFAVTALVLLVIGYLYTRFRERIEAYDRA